MKSTHALLALLIAGATFASPCAHAKNDGIVGQHSAHASAQRSNLVSGDSVNNLSAGGRASSSTASSSSSGHAPSSGNSGTSCSDSSSNGSSTAIGSCDSRGDGGNADDSHADLGWQSLLPGSIQ